MTNIINENLNHWEDFVVARKPIVINKAITNITFDILMKTLYGGISVDIPYVANLIRESSVLNKVVSLKLFKIFALPYYFKIRNIKKKLFVVADSMVEQSLASPQNNLMTLLINAYKGKAGGELLKKTFVL